MFEQNYVDVPSTSICSLEMEYDEIQPSRSFVFFHKHLPVISSYVCWLGYYYPILKLGPPYCFMDLEAT